MEVSVSMNDIKAMFDRLTDEQRLAAFKRAIAELPEAESVVPESIGPKFNYCVGAYWPKDYFSDGKSIGTYIGTYTYHHDVFYGTMAEAEEFLAYVKRQSHRDWQIFKIVPLTAV
jgi:hypothetical protein